MQATRREMRAPEAPMPDPTDVEARLTELEAKSAFAEDLLDSLNTLVARQQQQIEFLVKELMRLREQAGGTDPFAGRSLRDELPPHY